MKEKVLYFMKKPNFLLLGLVYHFASHIPDVRYIKIVYFLLFGRRLNLRNPKFFNEKLQWLKLYNRRPEYTQMVDKYGVKDYVSKIIGKEHVIPTLGIWDTFEDIDFDTLPDKFVLKTTHGGGGGGVVICRGKDSFDFSTAKSKIKGSLLDDGYTKTREWPYKNVPHRVIAEQLLENSQGKEEDLTDYKWFCFNGEPKYCQVIQDRSHSQTIDFFDTEWEHQVFFGLCLSPKEINATIPPMRPVNLNEQIRIARELSKGIPFSRIDLYEVCGKTYFGEITLFPASGFGEFYPHKYNAILGDMIKLPHCD